MIRLIAAIDSQLGLAKHGYIPWNIPQDRSYFAKQTKKYGANVLTGRMTYGFGYKNNKPLADRHNYVLSRSLTHLDGATVVSDLKSFLDEFKQKDLWIAGGESLFKQVMSSGQADVLYLTQINADFGCDQFFPDFKDDYTLIEKSEKFTQNGFSFYFTRYEKS